MIERLADEGERHPEQADRAAARPRLVMAWNLDPATGKPAARWVREAPEASAELATAA
jgi:hypothetical protein